MQLVNNNQLIAIDLVNLFNNTIIKFNYYNNTNIRQMLGQINIKYKIVIFKIINNQLALVQSAIINNDMIMDIIDQFLFISGYQSEFDKDIFLIILKINTILIKNNFNKALIPYIGNYVITIIWS